MLSLHLDMGRYRKIKRREIEKEMKEGRRGKLNWELESRIKFWFCNLSWCNKIIFFFIVNFNSHMLTHKLIFTCFFFLLYDCTFPIYDMMWWWCCWSITVRKDDQDLLNQGPLLSLSTHHKLLISLSSWGHYSGEGQPVLLS